MKKPSGLWVIGLLLLLQLALQWYRPQTSGGCSGCFYPPPGINVELLQQRASGAQPLGDGAGISAPGRQQTDKGAQSDH